MDTRRRLPLRDVLVVSTVRYGGLAVSGRRSGVRSAVLPFGGALSLVVVDDSVIDAYIGDEPTDMSECVTRQGQPKSGMCTFGY